MFGLGGVAAVHTLISTGQGGTGISCGFGALAELLLATGLMARCKLPLPSRDELVFREMGFTHRLFS